ncbi:hypothetical protein IK146_02820 [Candidatus Saccharibacteria bacterium]|nr:hypothetical protein [Candidatus Saccharibacteria bacterium]
MNKSSPTHREVLESRRQAHEDLFISAMAQADRRIDAFYEAKPFKPEEIISDWIKKDSTRLINGETTNHVTRPRLNIIQKWEKGYTLWQTYCDGICRAIQKHNKRMQTTGGPYRPIQMESFPNWS